MANRDFFRRLGLADEVAVSTLAKLKQPKTLRRILLTLGPVLVLAGGLAAYMTGGRYVSTDNAYVHAGKLTVATDVSGIVADVAVHDPPATLHPGFRRERRPPLTRDVESRGGLRNRDACAWHTSNKKRGRDGRGGEPVAFGSAAGNRTQAWGKRARFTQVRSTRPSSRAMR